MFFINHLFHADHKRKTGSGFGAVDLGTGAVGLAAEAADLGTGRVGLGAGAAGLEVDVRAGGTGLAEGKHDGTLDGLGAVGTDAN